MKRRKKIRGQKKIHRRIADWSVASQKLSLDILKMNKREFTKVNVYPFSSLDMGGSLIPAPKGKTRSLITSSLFDIFFSWKKELDTLNKPYYLKIWFYPENVARSQVVCAIDEMIDWYKDIFNQSTFGNARKIDTIQFGRSADQATDLAWEIGLHEEGFGEDYVSDPSEWYSIQDFFDSRRWFNRKLKKPHRTVIINGTTHHLFPMYNVYIGGS